METLYSLFVILSQWILPPPVFSLTVAQARDQSSLLYHET